MAGRLKTELRQSKPFATLEQEAFLNLQRTADHLMRQIEEALKPAGLTPTQYNVLRILRGAGPDGLACREIGERMLTRDPDITRLLDRMEARSLIERARERKDRRVVVTRITREGLRLLKELDGPVCEAHQQALGHLGAQRLRSLIELLEAAREKTG